MSEGEEVKEESAYEEKSAEKESLQAPKNRPRPPAKDKPKKKKHLLSFEEEVDENEEKIKKFKNSQHKHKIQEKKGVNKETLEEDLKRQFIERTEKFKEELFQFQYSYWEGANIVKKLRRKKKEKIKELLEVARLQLIQNFQNLAQLKPSDLLFVIKDFIVPHEVSISEVEALDLQTTKGDKLLNFKDVKVKKDGKELTLSVNIDGPIRVVERSKYEKNKTIFPFVNWRTINI